MEITRHKSVEQYIQQLAKQTSTGTIRLGDILRNVRDITQEKNASKCLEIFIQTAKKFVQTSPSSIVKESELRHAFTILKEWDIEAGLPFKVRLATSIVLKKLSSDDSTDPSLQATTKKTSLLSYIDFLKEAGRQLQTSLLRNVKQNQDKRISTDRREQVLTELMDETQPDYSIRPHLQKTLSEKEQLASRILETFRTATTKPIHSPSPDPALVDPASTKLAIETAKIETVKSLSVSQTTTSATAGATDPALLAQCSSIKNLFDTRFPGFVQTVEPCKGGIKITYNSHTPEEIRQKNLRYFQNIVHKFITEEGSTSFTNPLASFVRAENLATLKQCLSKQPEMTQEATFTIDGKSYTRYKKVVEGRPKYVVFDTETGQFNEKISILENIRMQYFSGREGSIIIDVDQNGIFAQMNGIKTTIFLHDFITMTSSDYSSENGWKILFKSSFQSPEIHKKALLAILRENNPAPETIRFFILACQEKYPEIAEIGLHHGDFKEFVMPQLIQALTNPTPPKKPESQPTPKSIPAQPHATQASPLHEHFPSDLGFVDETTFTLGEGSTQKKYIRYKQKDSQKYVVFNADDRELCEGLTVVENIRMNFFKGEQGRITIGLDTNGIFAELNGKRVKIPLNDFIEKTTTTYTPAAWKKMFANKAQLSHFFNHALLAMLNEENPQFNNIGAFINVFKDECPQSIKDILTKHIPFEKTLGNLRTEITKLTASSTPI